MTDNLAKAKAAQDAVDNAEKLTVLSQPHRRGSRSQLRESALGRFVEDQRCGAECYEAGIEYLCLVSKWRRARGIPVPSKAGEFDGQGGGDIDDESVAKWFKRIKACEFALIRVGATGFVAANDLILDDKEPVRSIIDPVKRALLSLAIELGRFPY